MKFIEDFKKFIFKGNVIDMAVGVVIGASFGKIVTGLVNYIINPFVGIFVKSGNLDSIKTVISKAVVDEAGNVVTPENAILWGTWIQTIIDFLLTALCIFIVLRILMKAKNTLEHKKIEAEKKKAEEEAKKAEEAAKAERDKSMSLQPGVAVGTMDPQDDEKVVYLTFDDGPSANTQRVLDILDQYDAKATFFITAQQPDYFPMIKKVYDEGHTVGLHSYTHEYDQVYASVDAYFDDLEKIGEVAKEQLGFVPCFIRFPGGASNSISKKYSAGIMTQLTQQVLDKGYQYYDWNVSSGDGGTVTADQIIAQSETDEYTKVMLLFHDTEAKESTIQALPTVMEYYKNLGYSFKAIDRESLVVHHSVNN